jgi:sphinganine-1-phosphate aldolase
MCAQVPVGRDYRVSAAAVARALTRNTVLVVASSPCYPHGVIDDVAGIARVRPAPGPPSALERYSAAAA